VDAYGRCNVTGLLHVNSPATKEDENNPHLEVYANDSGDFSSYTKIRFHQGNQYWGWLGYHGLERNTSGEFVFWDLNKKSESQVRTGNIVANGRIRSGNVRKAVSASDFQTTSVTDWRLVPGMEMSIALVSAAPVLVTFNASGVQCTSGDTGTMVQFQLLINGAQKALAHHEFDKAGWRIRDVFMVHLAALDPGVNSISVRWRINPGSPAASQAGVGQYSSTRSLCAIEL
jgi:hypothetical protein